MRALLVVGPEELVGEVLSVVLEQDVGVVGLRDEFAPQEHFLDEFVDVGVLLGAWKEREMVLSFSSINLLYSSFS